MYSQDPKVRRRKVQLRFFAYGVMTLATVVFAVLGTFYVLGYRLDNSFEVQRGGLLKFDSRPQSATISLNGTSIEQTPYQVNRSAGELTVGYTRDGYQGWQKNVNLRSGEVLWLNYARLIPNSITTEAIQTFPSVHQTSASPDREWLAVHVEPSVPEFTLFDVRNEGDIKQAPLRLPEGVASPVQPGARSVYEIVSWDVDSDFLLVRHRFGSDMEYLRVERSNPDESVNLNAEFGLKLRNAQFAANTANVAFASNAAGTLYRLDLNDTENPITVARGVGVFDNLDESRVAFVAPGGTPNTRMLNIWRRSGSQTTPVRTLPAGESAYVSYNAYLTHDYVALMSEEMATIVQDPLLAGKKTVFSKSLPFAPAVLKPSPGNRFFMMQRGDTALVYDLELGREHTIRARGQGDRPMQWADDHHLAMSGSGNLRLVEFDNSNMQFIASVKARHDVIIGADGEVLLSVGAGNGAEPWSVQRSYLLTEADRNRGFL